MEYEVLEKNEGIVDGSSRGTICEETRVREKCNYGHMEKGNQHPMTKIIGHEISIEKA